MFYEKTNLSLQQLTSNHRVYSLCKVTSFRVVKLQMCCLALPSYLCHALPLYLWHYMPSQCAYVTILLKASHVAAGDWAAIGTSLYE